LASNAQIKLAKSLQRKVNDKFMKTKITRRRFLRASALSGAGLLILRDSKLAFAYAANDKLNIALIGVGGRGK
jgi:hypothetical protein